MSGQRQKPCTSARGSLKIKPKILRALRVFVVKNAPQISATTQQRTDIFIKNIFQNVDQLPSEQHPLCVNNPGVVERERSQTGLPGQQPPPRATCPDPRRPGPVETVQPSRRLSALPDPSFSRIPARLLLKSLVAPWRPPELITCATRYAGGL